MKSNTTAKKKLKILMPLKKKIIVFPIEKIKTMGNLNFPTKTKIMIDKYSYYATRFLQAFYLYVYLFRYINTTYIMQFSILAFNAFITSCY